MLDLPQGVPTVTNARGSVEIAETITPMSDGAAAVAVGKPSRDRIANAAPRLWE
jgi:hypothetical protein